MLQMLKCRPQAPPVYCLCCRGLDLPAAIVTLLPAGGGALPAAGPPINSPLFKHIQAHLVEQVLL